MEQIDPADRFFIPTPMEEASSSLFLLGQNGENQEHLLASQKPLDSEAKTFDLGLAIVVAMALVAGWWIWCEHDAELVEARAKVEQMERRISDSSLNAQELRALYRIKMRGRR